MNRINLIISLMCLREYLPSIYSRHVNKHVSITLYCFTNGQCNGAKRYHRGNEETPVSLKCFTMAAITLRSFSMLHALILNLCTLRTYNLYFQATIHNQSLACCCCCCCCCSQNMEAVSEAVQKYALVSLLTYYQRYICRYNR